MKQKEPTKEQIEATKKVTQLKKIAGNDDILCEWLEITKPTLYKRKKDQLWDRGLRLTINDEYSKKRHLFENKYNIPTPTSQNEEVLFELINNNFIDRPMMMNQNHIWNLTARISELRNNALLRNNIQSNEFAGLNKYNREVKFVNYSLIDKEEAISVYLEMINNH